MFSDTVPIPVRAGFIPKITGSLIVKFLHLSVLSPGMGACVEIMDLNN